VASSDERSEAPRTHHDSIESDAYDACVRTTVTLDDDVVAALHAVMRERGMSFKQALNELVRVGIATSNPPARPYRLRPAPLGVRPGIDLEKANRLASELEDEELVRKYELGK
jgi:hypothetical protein